MSPLYSRGSYNALNFLKATWTTPEDISNNGGIVGETDLGPFL
jgi:hypothetical protein